MGLEGLSEWSEVNEDRFERVSRPGYREAWMAPKGLNVYDRANVESQRVGMHRFLYSLEFLEIHDVFAKYKYINPEFEINDEFISEIFEYYVELSREDVKAFLNDIGFGTEVVDEMYERLQIIQELNGSSENLLEELDLMSADLLEIFVEQSNDLNQKDFMKAAFAIYKISERASYSNDFNFIDNVIKYFSDFMNLKPQELDSKKKKELIEVINRGARNPVFDLLNNYAHPFFRNYKISLIKSINEPFVWYALYKRSIYFLLKVLGKNSETKEETYKRIISLYGDCGGLLPKTLSVINDSITYTDLKGAIDFENFGEWIQNLIVDNSGCRNEKEWKIFSLSTFFLEVLGKINQIRSLQRSSLEDANSSLIQKFLNASDNEVQYVLDEEASNDRYTVILSKINIDGQVIPLQYRFAVIKSEESMLRKTLVKDISVPSMKDKFRMMIVLPKGSLSDSEMRRKICSSIINTHILFLGNEVVSESMKNTFTNGSSNEFSLGALRCFKYATKFEVEGFTDTVEIMILEKYPNDHDDYESKMYKNLRETFALCGYEKAMQELAEELSRKSYLGFNKRDLHMLRPLISYVLNSEASESAFPDGFKNSLFQTLTIVSNSEELGIEKTQAITCLRILGSMVD